MRVYDFDKTIFYPDSSACFVKFCAKRMPLKVLPGVLAAIPQFVLWRLGKSSAKNLKSSLFSFLKRTEQAEALVSAFWDTYRGNIGEWYLAQRQPDDVIISASPEFLLRPVAEELGFGLIGTEMNIINGIITGENCYGSEKVKRFYSKYPEGHIDEFYSDSMSDSPLAEIADTAFLVDKGKLSPWPRK